MRRRVSPPTCRPAPAWILALAAIAVTVPRPARALVRDVGPGQPFATPSDVPWESLAAGDTVRIHARPAPYRDKWVLCRVGTAAAPIVVCGVPDATTGARPVIEGQDAVTRGALNYWNEERGVIKVGGANQPPDVLPAWIAIEGLEIRGARPEYAFTGRNGLTAYAANASAIYVEKGQHVTIRDCLLADASNGFFCASGAADVTVEGCWIHDTGNVGSIYEHNIYTEASGITFQFNRLGPLRAGAGGNNLKDRSAGTVIRYNWIEGGNRQLDLVDSDSPALRADPRYRAAFVYGNVLIENDADGNSQVAHYGGDSGQQANYRQGTLYFHFNTVISRRTGNTTLLRLSSNGESADVRDNVLYVTAAGSRLALLDQDGTLDATRNWLKPGWVASHGGGSPQVVDHGQVTGADPGFIDFAGGDFAPAAGSPCLDQAVPLAAAALPDHLPRSEYAAPQGGRDRPDDGAPDLGAFERAGTVDVPAGGPGPAPGRLRVAPNPARSTFRVWLEEPARTPGLALRPLVVHDARGRRVAALAPAAPGRWTWSPPAGLPPGVYLLELGGERHPVIVLAR